MKTDRRMVHAPRARHVLVLIFAIAPGGAGCAEVEPAVGDLRPACVDDDSNPSQSVDYKTRIRPLFDGKVAGVVGCEGCHYDSTGTREGLLATGLDLETLVTLRRGGRNTPPDKILVPGKPCSSAIVMKLEGTFAGARMPKQGPAWDTASIQLMKDWIAEGARGEDE